MNVKISLMVKKSRARIKKRLPEFLEKLFWEYDFETLDITADEEVIISKILRDGDMEALKWLFKTFGKERIREWIIETEGKGLSNRQLSFWEIVLSLPHSKVLKWQNEKSRKVWERR